MAASQVAASGRLESVDRGRTVAYTGAAGRRGGPWRPAESEDPRDRVFVDADARGSPSDPPGWGQSDTCRPSAALLRPVESGRVESPLR